MRRFGTSFMCDSQRSQQLVLSRSHRPSTVRACRVTGRMGRVWVPCELCDATAARCRSNIWVIRAVLALYRDRCFTEPMDATDKFTCIFLYFYNRIGSSLHSIWPRAGVPVRNQDVLELARLVRDADFDDTAEALVVALEAEQAIVALTIKMERRSTLPRRSAQMARRPSGVTEHDSDKRGWFGLIAPRELCVHLQGSSIRSAACLQRPGREGERKESEHV
jgi:hypothetical protein